MIVQFTNPLTKVKASFKFLNLWVDRDDFLGFVADTWQRFMDGNPMYKFTKRFRLLKPKLKSLHHQHTSHITSHVIEAKTRWTATQFVLDDSPNIDKYQRAEKELANEFFLIE